MDFAFTHEQQALKDSTRRLAGERIAPIAEEADESGTVHRGLMDILAESELLRHTVPEGYGGFGVKVMNLCIIREELGPGLGPGRHQLHHAGAGELPHHARRHPRAEGPLLASRGPGRVHRRLRPDRTRRRFRRAQHDPPRPRPTATTGC